MRNLIFAFFLFIVSFVNAQEIKLLHINSQWNQSNNYDLKRRNKPDKESRIAKLIRLIKKNLKHS